jgi:hypothetical protein
MGGRLLRLVDWVGWLVLLPFRLVGWTVAVIGRALGLVVGFGLMVVGVALLAGSLMVLGIPVFLVGLLLTMRALG